MSTIFISYRRDDSVHAALHVRSAFVAVFGADEVFLDYDGIRLGQDFVEVLEDKLRLCQAMIVLIGPSWLNARDPRTGRLRIDDPNDFVHREIAAALRREIGVLPFLLEGAVMPTEADLPEPIAPLARRQALTLSNARFDADLRDAIVQVHWTLAQAEDRLVRKTGVVRLLEPRDGTGETPSWMRFVPREEERRAWAAIAESDDVAAFRRHRAAFPTGAYADLAARRIDDIVWRDALYSRDYRQIASYLMEFPEGEHRAKALRLRNAINRRRDRADDQTKPRSRPA